MTWLGAVINFPKPEEQKDSSPKIDYVFPERPIVWHFGVMCYQISETPTEKTIIPINSWCDIGGGEGAPKVIKK